MTSSVSNVPIRREIYFRKRSKYGTLGSTGEREREKVIVLLNTILVIDCYTSHVIVDVHAAVVFCHTAIGTQYLVIFLKATKNSIRWYLYVQFKIFINIGLIPDLLLCNSRGRRCQTKFHPPSLWFFLENGTICIGQLSTLDSRSTIELPNASLLKDSRTLQTQVMPRPLQFYFKSCV